MDNLQWFKFSPADWMMGRIQRQPAQVQVDFLRVCCQYWKNEGNYSIEDAKLEAMDSYETLVKYRIIKEEGNDIVIDFLDEQLESIEDRRKQASEAGKRSAEARKRRAKSNDRSTTVQRPINEGSTESNRVEERREEKRRVDKNREDDGIKPPSLEEVISYFDENGYTKESATKMWEYYEESRKPRGIVWKDGRGNTVKNWKQKARSIWFKDDNLKSNKEYDFKNFENVEYP